MENIFFRLIGVVVLVTVSFQPGCRELDNSIYNKICFKWEWTKSTGGIGGVVKTPESEGYTQSVDFDKNGLYVKYRNNAAEASGTYNIVRAQSELDGQEYDMVILDEGLLPQAIIQVTENELILREECYDCFTHHYRRDPASV